MECNVNLINNSNVIDIKDFQNINLCYNNTDSKINITNLLYTSNITTKEAVIGILNLTAA